MFHHANKNIFFVLIISVIFTFISCSNMFQAPLGVVEFSINLPKFVGNNSRNVSSDGGNFVFDIKLCKSDNVVINQCSKSVSLGGSFDFSFNDIIIGESVYIEARLSDNEDVCYGGKSEIVKIKSGANKVSIILEKLPQYTLTILPGAYDLVALTSNTEKFSKELKINFFEGQTLNEILAETTIYYQKGIIESQFTGFSENNYEIMNGNNIDGSTKLTGDITITKI